MTQDLDAMRITRAQEAARAFGEVVDVQLAKYRAGERAYPAVMNTLRKKHDSLRKAFFDEEDRTSFASFETIDAAWLEHGPAKRWKGIVAARSLRLEGL